MTVTREFVKMLPKVELHCHIDGSIRTSTIKDLAVKHGFKLPTHDLKKLEKYVRVSPNCRSLTEFLQKFEFFYDFLKFPDAVERITCELCEDVAAENVRYLEARFAPHLQATPSFPAREVVERAVKAIESGARKNSIGAGIIICIYRTLPPEMNDEAVKLAGKYFGKGVVGIDLAGDESGFPTQRFSKYFKYAKERKIPITCHAGEAAGAESIRQAVELGASRIGHGTRLYENAKLYNKVRRDGIPLEVCLTSNVQTRVVKNYDSHPFKRYYRDGLKVTLNTDDRSVSGIDLTGEYMEAVKNYGLGINDLVALILNAAGSVFLPGPDRTRVVSGIRKELESALKSEMPGQTKRTFRRSKSPEA